MIDMEKENSLNLKKRYLLWLYKTTKESLDRIDRKFTQLDIDGSLLSELRQAAAREKVTRYVEEFEAYVKSKEIEAKRLKYKGRHLQPEYRFLVLKLAAVEKTIRKELGDQGLDEIRILYQNEMEERILRSTEHT
jgi:hypothetical protein